MQSSNIPSKIPLPFAYGAGGGYINTIPTASQIGVTPGRASLTDGFPPLTFTPIASGGVPPFGADMNGILNEITAIQQWQEAGGFFPFDATFATAIGGYPKGAILQSSTQAGLWVSTIENNSNNPDTTGTGWLSFAFEGAQAITISGTTTALTNLQSAYPILIVSGTLTANSTITVPPQAGEWIIVNNTTGSFTLTFKTVAGTGVTVPQGYSTLTYGDGTNIYLSNSATVTSFNGRTGTISLNATDVTSALGYTPLQYGLGVGQTWQDVTSSRTSGTTYTNSTSRPIQVIVSFPDTGSNAIGTCVVDGVTLINLTYDIGSGSATLVGQFIVPSGSTYSATASGSASISKWCELR